MKRTLYFLSFFLCISVLLTGCAKGEKKVSLDPENPVTVTIWHYYNGAQQEAFSELVDEFNAGKGAELGIQVVEFSQGTVEDLKQGVLDAASNKAGAMELPNIFAAYSDTAYELDKIGIITNLTPYFTKEEQEEYVEGYIKEGYLSGSDSLKIFPIAKCTEVLFLNKTDWQDFAEENDIDTEMLTTIEGVTEVAKLYYTWTDEKTPDVLNDGKAFFGRDAFANYMLIGAKQLGTEIFQVKDGICTLNFDKETVRKLWDNYYVPMVAGWFAAENRFRSDDVKMGNIIACVGSSSSATFFPDSCIVSDIESYPIELAVYTAPEFKDGEDYAVQQGAGMVVTEGEEDEIYASVEFLKWFTDSERNSDFAVSSSYLPVKREASTLDYMEKVMDQMNAEEKVKLVLTQAVLTTEENTMYTPLAFESGSNARTILENSMPEKAAQDREKFLELLNQGMDYEDALLTFDNDENFDEWYNTIHSQLEKFIPKQ